MRKIYILLFLTLIFISTIYLLGNYRQESIRDKVIVLVFDPDLKDLFERYGFRTYLLDNSYTGKIFYGDRIIVITHAAVYYDRLLLALNAEPDMYTLYAISINGSLYKALPVEAFAEHIYAEELFIASCYLDRGKLYYAFEGHAGRVYFYSDNATTGYVVYDALSFALNGSFTYWDNIDVIDYS